MLNTAYVIYDPQRRYAGQLVGEWVQDRIRAQKISNFGDADFAALRLRERLKIKCDSVGNTNPFVTGPSGQQHY